MKNRRKKTPRQKVVRNRDQGQDRETKRTGEQRNSRKKRGLSGIRTNTRNVALVATTLQIDINQILQKLGIGKRKKENLKDQTFQAWVMSSSNILL